MNSDDDIDDIVRRIQAGNFTVEEQRRRQHGKRVFNGDFALALAVGQRVIMADDSEGVYLTKGAAGLLSQLQLRVMAGHPNAPETHPYFARLTDLCRFVDQKTYQNMLKIMDPESRLQASPDPRNVHGAQDGATHEGCVSEPETKVTIH